MGSPVAPGDGIDGPTAGGSHGRRAVAVGGGLAVERFDYARVGPEWAVLRLLAQVQAHLGAPSDAGLLIRRGAGYDDVLYPARACAYERRLMAPPAGTGETHGDGELLWRAAFAVPLEVVEFQRAIFELTAVGRVALALPTPGLRIVNRRSLQLAANGRGAHRRCRIGGSGARHRLAALATTVVVTTSSTPAASLASASGQPGPGATTTTTTTTTTQPSPTPTGTAPVQTGTETTTASTTTTTTTTTPPTAAPTTPPASSTAAPPASPPTPSAPPAVTTPSKPRLPTLSPMAAKQRGTSRERSRLRRLNPASITHVFTAPGTAAVSPGALGAVICTVSAKRKPAPARVHHRLRSPAKRPPLARMTCTTPTPAGKHGHGKRTGSKPGNRAAAPGSPLRRTAPEKRSAHRAAGAHPDGGAAVTPLGGISAEPPTPLSGNRSHACPLHPRASPGRVPGQAP